jgi:DNA-binding transcriptional regulator YiaG
VVENAACIKVVALPKTDSRSATQGQFAIATLSQGFIAFLPYKMLRLTTSKPQHFPLAPKTLGEHLRKRRYEGNWQQKEVALRLGVNQWTLIGWETDRSTPSVRMLPRIMDFLGYNPFPEPVTLGELIVAKRRSFGIARKRLAWALGVDENVLQAWEAERKLPTGEHRDAIEWFLTAPPNAIEAIVPQPGRRHTIGDEARRRPARRAAF